VTCNDLPGALAAVGLAVLVASAGCTGTEVLGGDGPTTRERYGVPSTATGTDATTPSVRSPTVTVPGRPGVADHQRALLDAGSYTMEIVINDSRGSRARNYRQVFRINLTEERYYSNVAVPGISHTRIVYQGDVGTFHRFVDDDGVSYVNDTARSPAWPDSPLRRSLAVGGRTLVRRIARYDFERAGTAEFDGGRLERYVASGTDNASGPGTVTAFVMVILVDDRGIVRRVESTTRGRVEGKGEYVLRYRFSVTGLGTTSVTPPDWVENASAPAGSVRRVREPPLD